MKLSVQSLWRSVLKTVKRFPFSVADSLAVTVLALTYDAWHSDGSPFFKLLLTSILGFPLLLSLKLFAERKAWSAEKQSLFTALGLVPLGIYFFTLSLQDGDAASIRFAILLICSIFLLSFAPYTSRGEVNGFWRYNKSLVMGAAVSGLSAVALLAGIGIAFGGMDYLLGIDFPNKFYGKLWLLNICFMWPFIFLAVLPENFGQLEAAEIFDKLLETFVRFIVIPLVLVYMLILYIYAGKIVIQASWPKGGVAGFILGFSSLGLLSVLLIHPLREREGTRWIKSYLKWLVVFILPQTGVLLLAVWRRVADYGVTETRYFGILSAFWLAAICLYFLLSKAKSIKIISVSLCIVALLSAFGPWGALAVSARSQVHRLEGLLEKNGVLAAGKVVKANLVSEEAQREISMTVRYLNERHGLAPFKKLFGTDLDTVASRERPEKIMSLMGLTYAPSVRGRVYDGARHFSYYAKGAAILPITGFDYYLRLGPRADEDSCGDDGAYRSYVVDMRGIKYRVSLIAKTGKLVISRDKQTLGALDIFPLVRKLRKQYRDAPGSYNTIPWDAMIVEGMAGPIPVKIVFEGLNVKELGGGLELTSATGDVLMKVRD